VFARPAQARDWFELMLKDPLTLGPRRSINDPNDFGVGRSLNATNWLALTRIGR